MFEVFATMCFLSNFGYMTCEDYVVDSYDDQVTCEIVAAERRKDRRYILAQCIPGPEVEPMP